MSDVVALKEIAFDEERLVLLKQLQVDKIGVFLKYATRKHNGFFSEMVNSCPEPSFDSALLTYSGFFFFPLGLIYRSLQEKSFFYSPINDCGLLFYVAQSFEGKIKDFSFGVTVVMVEGFLDAEALSRLTGYDYVMAVLTSRVGALLAGFVSTITDRVLLVPDNDKAGRDGAEESARNLKKVGVESQCVFTDRKDFFDVFKYNDKLDVGRVRAAINLY